MNYANLGKRLREERRKAGLTQEKLAEDLDLSAAYIGQIERGERVPALAIIIAAANRLGVSVDYLLEDTLSSATDTETTLLLRLMEGRSQTERKLAVDIIRTIFGALDRDLDKEKQKST